MTEVQAPAREDTWHYDRHENLHVWGYHTATVQKVGERYQWAVTESPANYYGHNSTLKGAKQSAENRMHKPEPQHYRCFDCKCEIVCSVEWAGHPYYSWAQHLPGAIQMIPSGMGFLLVRTCMACCETRAAKAAIATDAATAAQNAVNYEKGLLGGLLRRQVENATTGGALAAQIDAARQRVVQAEQDAAAQKVVPHG